jgi:hypothetical protein
MDAVEAYRYAQLLGAIQTLKREIHAKIDSVIEGQQHIMALVDQEDAELTAIEASLVQLGQGITAVLAEVAGAGGNQVTQTQVDRLTAIATALQGDVAQLPAVAPVVAANTGVGALPGSNPIVTPVPPVTPAEPVTEPITEPVVAPEPVVEPPVVEPAPVVAPPVTPVDLAGNSVEPSIVEP